jgi:hypothetical protein
MCDPKYTPLLLLLLLFLVMGVKLGLALWEEERLTVEIYWAAKMVCHIVM